jgi:hypothetical protein
VPAARIRSAVWSNATGPSPVGSRQRPRVGSSPVHDLFEYPHRVIAEVFRAMSPKRYHQVPDAGVPVAPRPLDGFDQARRPQPAQQFLEQHRNSKRARFAPGQ